MKVVLWEAGEARVWEVEACNIPQIKNWLARNEPDVWGRVGARPYKYGVGRIDGSKPTVALHPALTSSDLSEYDVLIIAEDVEGETVFSAIAGAVAAAVTAAVGATAAAVIGAVVAAVVLIGISYALGQIIQMLSPNQKVSGQNTIDAAIAQKNMLFNGVANIREQGGGVPLVFGECLVGGVVISVRVGTSEAMGTSLKVNSMSDAMSLGNEGKWLCLAQA